MAAIGRPDLAARPALRHQCRPLLRERDELDAAIAAWTRTLPAKRGGGAAGRRRGAVLAAVRHADCADDPHFRARDWCMEVEDPLIGRTLHPGRRSGWMAMQPEAVVGWPGPAAGAHTPSYVLRTLLATVARRAMTASIPAGVLASFRQIHAITLRASRIIAEAHAPPPLVPVLLLLVLVRLCLAWSGGRLCRRFRPAGLRPLRPRAQRSPPLGRRGRLVVAGGWTLRPRQCSRRSAACWCFAARAGCRAATSPWCRRSSARGRSW